MYRQTVDLINQLSKYPKTGSRLILQFSTLSMMQMGIISKDNYKSITHICTKINILPVKLACFFLAYLLDIMINLERLLTYLLMNYTKTNLKHKITPILYWCRYGISYLSFQRFHLQHHKCCYLAPLGEYYTSMAKHNE